MTGPTNTVLGSASGVQLFAGIRDDPFYIDLEQFFKIIPDRAPVAGSTVEDRTEAGGQRVP